MNMALRRAMNRKLCIEQKMCEEVVVKGERKQIWHGAADCKSGVKIEVLKFMGLKGPAMRYRMIILAILDGERAGGVPALPRYSRVDKGPRAYKKDQKLYCQCAMVRKKKDSMYG